MPHVYQLVTNLHGGAGNFFANVFHFELSESGSGIHPFDYADALVAEWVTIMNTKYLALFGDDVVLDFISAKKVNEGGGPSAAHAVNAAGGAASQSSTTGASADVQWQTGSSNNRPGHTYLAAFPYDQLQADAFLALYLGHVGTWIGQMLTPMTLAGALGSATFGIYTRKTNTFNVTNSGRVRPKVTMMNKRLLPQV